MLSFASHAVAFVLATGPLPPVSFSESNTVGLPTKDDWDVFSALYEQVQKDSEITLQRGTLLKYAADQVAVSLPAIRANLSGLGVKDFDMVRPGDGFNGVACGGLFALISAFVNWRLGFAEINIFDPMIFKSLLVVFGFTVGFRNVNAAELHAQGLKHCTVLMASLLGIVILFVDMDDCRQRVHDSLRRVLQAFANHILLISDRRTFWYALADLDPILPSCSQVPSATPSKETESLDSDGAAKDGEQPEQKNAAAAFMSDAACKASALGRTAALAAAAAATAPFGDDWAATATPTLISGEAGFSPRLLFTSTLVWCEEELEKYEMPLGQQKLRRAF